MGPERIQIGELNLSLPDGSPERARLLARQIARGLSEQATMVGRCKPGTGPVEVEVSLPPGTNPFHSPGRIVEAILKEIQT